MSTTTKNGTSSDRSPDRFLELRNIHKRFGGVHALRGGTVAGVHEVSFFGQDEEVTLTHRATSRQIFVNGALAAAQKLVTREPGFYTFDKVMFA